MLLKNITKCINTNKKASDFLNSDVDIVEIYGGKKVFLCLIQNTGNVYEDWIIKHNEHIHYYSEFDYATLSQSKNSCGESQYKIIFDKIKEVDYSDLEPGTIMRLFFIDNNTTNNDKTKHDLMHEIYLGTITTCDFEIKAEKIIITNERIYDSDSIKHYAEKFGFKLVEPVFYGKLRDIFDNIDNINNAVDNIDNKTFIKKAFLKLLKEHIKQATPGSDNLDLLEIILNTLKEYISLNKTINQIIIYNRETDEGFQVIDDNTDIGIKDDKNYINQIRLIALGITNKLKRPFKPNKFKDILNQISDEIKNLKDLPQNKNKISVLDDIQHQCRQLVIKQIRGNNNFLYIGRIDLPTKEFFKNIKEKLKTHDGGVICLLSRASLKSTLELREKILTELFSNFDNIKIITNNNFNLDEIMKKSPVNINTILCSSKKLNDFKNIMINFPDLKLQEIDTGLSKEFLLKNIDNDIIFKSNTPKEIHHLYKLINDYYKSNPLTSTINESVFYVQAENQHWRSPFQRLDEESSDIPGEFIVAAFLKCIKTESLKDRDTCLKHIKDNFNDFKDYIKCDSNVDFKSIESKVNKKINDYFKIANKIATSDVFEKLPFDDCKVYLGSGRNILTQMRGKIKGCSGMDGHKYNPADILYITSNGIEELGEILKLDCMNYLTELKKFFNKDNPTAVNISIKTGNSRNGNIALSVLKNSGKLKYLDGLENELTYDKDANGIEDDEVFIEKIIEIYEKLKNIKTKDYVKIIFDDIKSDIKKLLKNSNSKYIKSTLLNSFYFLQFLDGPLKGDKDKIKDLINCIYYTATSNQLGSCKFYTASPLDVNVENGGEANVPVDIDDIVLNVKSGGILKINIVGLKKKLTLRCPGEKRIRFEIES